MDRTDPEPDPAAPYLTFAETVGVLSLIALIGTARVCQSLIDQFRRAVESLSVGWR